MIFDRLAIGTANFGREYNGVKVSEKEQVKILDYCKKVGINMIDTATAYGTHNIKAAGFRKVVKVNENDNLEMIEKIIMGKPYCIMAHNPDIYGRLVNLLRNKMPKKCGVSIYQYEDFVHYFERAVDVIQVPYSLYDRRIEKHLKTLKEMHTEIHVRSVFLRDRILEKALPHDCISFCLMNPYVDRVIIGVDSLEQLKQNLETFLTFDLLKIDDENIIDPRRWKNEPAGND